MESRYVKAAMCWDDAVDDQEAEPLAACIVACHTGFNKSVQTCIAECVCCQETADQGT